MKKLLTVTTGNIILSSFVVLCIFSNVIQGLRDFDPHSGYLYIDEDVERSVPEENGEDLHEIHRRWKRDAIEDLGINWKDLPGAGYLRKLAKISKEASNLPKPIKDAIKAGDFSNVTTDDVKQVNVSVLEYIPPKMMSKMNSSVLETILSSFLTFNRPNAMGRLMEAIGSKLSPASLIDKFSQRSISPDTNEAAGVMLHSAVSRLGDVGGLTMPRIEQMQRFDLLKYVPEEQLMKVNDSNVAKSLLSTLYGSSSQTKSLDSNEPDDKALVYKLVETSYGEPKSWSENTIQTVATKYLKFLPASVLAQFSPEKVKASIYNLREGTFDTPLQAKTITDSFLEDAGVKKDENGKITQADPSQMPQIFDTLRKFAAFVNPSATDNTNLLSTIINSCSQWNLPAPLQAVTKFLKNSFGGKKVEDLTQNDFDSITPDVLRNSPPELIGKSIETRGIDSKIKEMSASDPNASNGIFGNSFFKAMIAQVTTHVIKYFTNPRSNQIEYDKLPTPFLRGVGVKKIQEMSSAELEQLLDKLKDNPNAIDAEQKALLMKRLREAGGLDGVKIPPEISFLRPREKNDGITLEDIDGLPSDSEYRLAHGNGKIITASALERDPSLVGTLTPKQVEQLDLQNLPGVLAAVRKSKDGPQPQTLKALSKRFSEYLRLKSDELEDVEDKKLLKHITAAEVSKLPASVLAYFVDPRQTAKLPAAVRKEILIALGEMSTKDRAMMPDSTRELIITQGLDALDSILGDDSKKYDTPELAAIGHSVADLPPSKIAKLTPVAFEQALDMIQGTTEEDGGLKQRACLSPEQRSAWRTQILENYGKPKRWDPATVSTLCCLLPLLEEDDLLSIAKESIVSCECISDSPPPPHLTEMKKALDKSCEKRLGKPDETKRNFEKIKSERAIDLNELESQIISGRRRRRASEHDGHHDHSSHSPSGISMCMALRFVGPVDFENEDLEMLKPADMKNCLYELGNVKLSNYKEKILWEKLVEAYGGVRKIPQEELRNAGFILGGIKLSDVNELDYGNDDVIAAFGRPLGISKTVLMKMAENIEKVRSPQQTYQANDLIIIRNILCGFDLQSLKRIVPEALSGAMPILRDLDENCELTRLTALVNTATHEEVYGDPSNWTAAEVRGVGILLKGLSIDAKKIPPEAFLGLTPTVAAALNEQFLKELSKEQLSYFPRFAAQAMSEDQISFLSDDGKEALDVTLIGPRVSGTTFIHGNYFLLSLFSILTLYFS